ncbi:MAG TPA: hypothetical protein VMU83_10720 [Hanamia sp.]|nr:hypothetical protein [Hanamia sp.]
MDFVNPFIKYNLIQCTLFNVCVDMLGEGFDLPNLKIAAFHNIRKSLPITIQLAGRFTRTKFDENLGVASIVVNLKDADVKLTITWK